MKIPFTKMQAIGNDFIIINQIDQNYNLSQSQITKLANRHFGIGFDQLLIIEKSDDPTFDYRYRIFNADGSEVEHCGNGARCFYEYIQHHKLSSKNPITAQTLNGSISLAQDNGLISVDMGKFSIGNKDESSLFFEIYLHNDSEKMQGICIDVGNPHIVFLLIMSKILTLFEQGRVFRNPQFFLIV